MTGAEHADGPPPFPGPAVAHCYRCRGPADRTCRLCGRRFCRRHGGAGGRLCLGDWRRARAAGWGAALAAGVAALAVAAWWSMRD
jgi:hypothetical protein